ncbi:hypothetical protein GW17_00000262, partial [Ensete ventricosum]
MAPSGAHTPALFPFLTRMTPKPQNTSTHDGPITCSTAQPSACRDWIFTYNGGSSAGVVLHINACLYWSHSMAQKRYSLSEVGIRKKAAMAYDLVGFSSAPTSSSSSSPKPLVERDFLSRVEEQNYGMSGLDVSLSLRPPLTVIGKRCSACGETKTPLWRNGPDGPKVMIYIVSAPTHHLIHLNTKCIL